MNQTCPNCGSAIEQGDTFCNICGEKIPQNTSPQLTCPTCGKLFPQGLRYCDVDGTPLYSATNMTPQCEKCGRQFPPSVKFCPDDGGRVIIPQLAALKRKNEDGGTFHTTVLLIFAIIFSVCELIGLIISRLNHDWYMSSAKHIAYVFWTIEIIALLLIPLAIKKLPLKIIGFVLMTPIVILFAYYNLRAMFL